MARYRTFTTVTDNGPYVTKLILELPQAVRTQDVDEGTFSVYVERIDPRRARSRSPRSTGWTPWASPRSATCRCSAKRAR